MRKIINTIFIFFLVILNIFFGCSKKTEKQIKNDNAKETVELLVEKKIRYINSDIGLRIRKDPDINAEIVGVISFKEKVYLIEEVGDEITISGEKGRWSRIEWKDKSGWVFGGFLSNTLPKDEGVISGSGISYPSDYIPKDIIVYAENIDTGIIYSTDLIIEYDDEKSPGPGGIMEYAVKKTWYELKVPGGKYYVYSITSDMPEYKAYYSDFLICIDQNEGDFNKCTSHEPIIVKVEKGQVIENIVPDDWFAPR